MRQRWSVVALAVTAGTAGTTGLVERDVHAVLAIAADTHAYIVRLVSEGLRNKDIAAKLFISTRTVENHLTRIYAKLDLSSRVQLVQEAGRRSGPQWYASVDALR